VPDEPTLRQLKELIERNHADARDDYLDLKAQVARAAEKNDEKFKLYLLREVFDAKEAAMLQRIGVLEESARTVRTQVRGAIMASAGSVIAGILIAIILSVILKGGKP
jgi:hypothetical protein